MTFTDECEFQKAPRDSFGKENQACSGYKLQEAPGCYQRLIFIGNTRFANQRLQEAPGVSQEVIFQRKSNTFSSEAPRVTWMLPEGLFSKEIHNF